MLPEEKSKRERLLLDALNRELCFLRSKCQCLGDKLEGALYEIDCYKEQLGKVSTTNDQYRQNINEFRQCNTTLKWKKCDLEREVARMNATIDCLRQRLSYYSGQD